MKEKIRKILKENIYTEIKTCYPKEGSQDMKPWGREVVKGIDESVNQIMKLVKKELK